MSVEENKAAVRRLNEATNKGDVNVMSELFSPNYFAHNNPAMKGPEGMKQSHMALRTAFPDYQEKIEYMLAEGDMVAVFYTISGTFKGRYGDTTPTGKLFSVPLSVLARFENGKQVEAWLYMDSATWYGQLGIPAQP